MNLKNKGILLQKTGNRGPNCRGIGNQNFDLVKQVTTPSSGLNRGSYMSAHVLLNLLNKLGKKIRCSGKHLIGFP